MIILIKVEYIFSPIGSYWGEVNLRKSLTQDKVETHKIRELIYETQVEINNKR